MVNNAFNWDFIGNFLRKCVTKERLKSKTWDELGKNVHFHLGYKTCTNRPILSWVNIGKHKLIRQAVITLINRAFNWDFIGKFMAQKKAKMADLG